MAQVTRRRFTAAEYRLMLRSGILGEDDGVELIDGEILEPSPIGSGHAAQVKRIASQLHRVAAGRAIVSVQDLGLLLAASTVAAHGGQLRIANGSTGAEVTLRFPLGPAAWVAGGEGEGGEPLAGTTGPSGSAWRGAGARVAVPESHRRRGQDPAGGTAPSRN